MNLKRAGRKPLAITERELEIMKLLWNQGPMFVRELLEFYPDPKPHFNTVSTTIRILEDKGYVAHEVVGTSHRYYAVAQEQQFRDKSLKELISTFFNNSYRSAISALVEEEKISIEELKEIIDLVEKKSENTH
ncbi:MAG: BlaI/MecI/CopY family transcriptional regulator [Bacteroidales bacterium]|nr:BlaI/MecI/CopY family transcriptional regulator [Bacteroidales bacterium]MDE7466401.1 BlaI/MecI/CopY family transcriptional regulator [Muribaculaceae bacterium]